MQLPSLTSSETGMMKSFTFPSGITSRRLKKASLLEFKGWDKKVYYSCSNKKELNNTSSIVSITL
jgi:hypothetical protein